LSRGHEFVIVFNCLHLTYTHKHAHTHAHTHTHTHNRFMAMDFVRDNPGEPVPEETFTHFI